MTDKTYVTKAAVLEGYQFDRVSFGIGGKTFRSTDMVHWLALDICARALADAGHPNGEGLPRRETGVLIGNTLTGEFTRAELMRLRWPYVRRVINRALERQGWPASERGKFLIGLERQYKQPFAELNEDSLAGGLANTIAGRICNYFDFKGGGYILDGACSSSLLAVANACTSLAAGDLDVALAGGVDLSLDPFELVGFARTGALAKDTMRVYDQAPTGFIPGEGCGMVVLCRLEDALERGERVHAVIRGWGISSDGKGGITRPESEGQMIALERAYRKADIAPGEVVYFEGHGTGTSVGDAAELRALIQLRKGTGQVAYLGSVKANIGHTKAASGTAGLIKAIMALANQIVPPATACPLPHELLSGEESVIEVPQQGRLWPNDKPLVAGVSSFGFGGINTHLVLQSNITSRKLALTEGEHRLLASRQDSELFLLSAENQMKLERHVADLADQAVRLSRAELSDLASSLARSAQHHPLRAAIVASTPEQLAASLNRLTGLFAANETGIFDERAGLFYGEAKDSARVGFLFPGQAAPVRTEAGLAGVRFPWIDKRYRAIFAQQPASEAEKTHMAIVLGSTVCLELLRKVGIRSEVGLGHSLGELAALHHGGAMDADSLIELAAVRGRALHEHGEAGTMLAAAASADEITPLIVDRDVVIAAHNAPNQTVISGTLEELHAVEAALNLARIKAWLLDVTHAFHSPLVAGAEPVLRQFLAETKRSTIEGKIYSSVTGEALAADASLVDLLCDQLTHPVRFKQAFEAARSEVDLWIEVGPGKILASLVRAMGEPHVVATDMPNGLGGILKAVGAAYVLGHGVEPKVLFADRYTKPFDEYRQLTFLANPCEAAPPPEPVLPRVITHREVATEDDHETLPSISADQLLQELIARRAELPLESLRSDMRLLDDLHMSSIAVAEVITEAARRLGRVPPQAPTELANVTLSEAAEVIESSAQAGDLITENSPAGMGAWYRAFTIRWQERATDWAFPELEGGSLTVFGPVDLPLIATLQSIERHRLASDAVLVVLANDEDAAEYLPRGAQLAAKLKSAFVVISEQVESASFARCYAAEYPQSRVLALTLSFDDTVVNRLVEELAGLNGFLHVKYDELGHRQIPLWETVPTGKTGALEELGENDVLLVSAGGKGISAECALAIFRRTGVSLAILGRGDPAWDEELAANLDRFRREGSHFAYYRADVIDSLAVSTAVAEAEIRLGPVTAILHGAGVNQPKTVPNLTSEDMIATIGPKVDGLKNLLAAVSPDRLKLLVTFGSIISHLGLEGEAHYALANAVMAREVETFASLWPNCRSLNLEWSVWSGMGMGEKLGRVDALLQQGITPITPDQGSVLFEQILDDPDLQGSLIVSGRFGLPRTVAFAGSELPFARFLEHSRLYYPGIELVVDSELSLDTDPYLADHIYEGTQILPAVIAMEAMTQAATALHGGEDPPSRILDLRMERPIIIPPEGSTVIRLAALVHGNGSVEVGLRCGETGFHVDHFRALFDFQPAETVPELPETILGLEMPPLAMPREALYGPIFFHQGRFRRIRHYHLLSAWSCVAEIAGDEEEPWFGRFLPDTLYLGDPGRRDAVLHGIQACIPHKSMLPLACAEWQLFRRKQGDQLFYAREIARKDGAYTYDVDVIGEDGQLDECWRGLVFKEVYDREYKASWHPYLHPPYLQWILEEHSNFKKPLVVIETNDEGSPRRLMASIKHRLDLSYLAQSGAKNETPYEDGFFCYAGNLAAGCLSEGLMAVELVFIEAIGNSPQTDWLGEEETALAETMVERAGISSDEAWSRQLAARACLEKVGLPADTPLTLSAEVEGPLLRLSEGGMEVATLVLRVPDGPSLVLAVLYELRKTAPG